MSKSGKAAATHDIRSIAFYFDGMQRDRFDSGGLHRRAAECLLLREKLMKLPEEAYEVSMAAMLNLVRVASEDGQAPLNPSPGSQGPGPNPEALRLYEKTRESLEQKVKAAPVRPTSPL